MTQITINLFGRFFSPSKTAMKGKMISLTFLQICLIYLNQCPLWQVKTEIMTQLHCLRQSTRVVRRQSFHKKIQTNTYRLVTASTSHQPKCPNWMPRRQCRKTSQWKRWYHTIHSITSWSKRRVPDAFCYSKRMGTIHHHNHWWDLYQRVRSRLFWARHKSKSSQLLLLNPLSIILKLNIFAP